MKRGAKAESPFVGRWRITEMEVWDSDFLDMEVQAFIEFRKNGMGQFQFGLVSGCIDYHLTERDGKPAVEWSWDGNDECDPAQGRGWAVLETERLLGGRIFIHQGDNSSFRAEKVETGRSRAPRD
jgi:hypothetical protein